MNLYDLYDLSKNKPGEWPPKDTAWLKAYPTVECHRELPDMMASTPPLIPDHCRHTDVGKRGTESYQQGMRTLSGQCIFCGSFPEGNLFKRNIKK